MIYFLDFDFTIADTTPLKKGTNWREAQQFVPEITESALSHELGFQFS